MHFNEGATSKIFCAYQCGYVEREKQHLSLFLWLFTSYYSPPVTKNTFQEVQQDVETRVPPSENAGFLFHECF